MNKPMSIVLITDNYETDEIGQDIKLPDTEITLRCNVSSVSSAYRLQAGEEGQYLDYRASIWEREYNGETICRIGETRYRVYSTYSRNDGHIELYLSRRVGV